MARYKVEQGRCVIDHPTERVRVGGESWPADKLCVQGEVVETDTDLLRYNAPPSMANGVKFTKLDDAPEPETIEQLEARLVAMKAEQSRQSQANLNPEEREKQAKAVADAARVGFEGKAHVSADKLTMPAEPAKVNGTAVPLSKLQSMSVKQLQDLAAEEEIEVGNCSDKNQLIRLLRGGK